MRVALLIAVAAMLVLAALTLLLNISGNVQEPLQAHALSRECSKVAESIAPMKQTAHGYTVTLHPVYADANRVVVTYTVAVAKNSSAVATPFYTDRGGPDAQKQYAARLSDSSGREFPILNRPAGWVANDQVIYTSYKNGWEALAFDTSLSSLPASLDLNLTLDAAIFRGPSPYGGITSLGVDGPFTFHFSMPVDAVRRVAQVQETLYTKLGTYKLEKVTATCHGTRVFLDFERAEGYAPYDSYVTLEAEGYSTANGGLTPWTAHVLMTDIQFLGSSLMYAQGDWKVQVWSMYTGGRFEPDKVVGVFRFTMPPATPVEFIKP